MEESRGRYLRIALIVVGVAFLFFYPLMYLWPAGFQWTPSQPEYEQMIAVVYATLGVFLLLASRRPEVYLSLIWFTVWSSIVHGAIMAVQAVVDPSEHMHLLGDVFALFIVAIALAVLTPRGVPEAGKIEQLEAALHE